MKRIELLISRYKFWRFKKNLRNKIYKLNNHKRTTKSAKKEYHKKEVEKSKHDTQIKAYLSIHQSDIVGISTGWFPYLYQMMEELIENGLQIEDKIWAKEKYAEFRCFIKAKDKEKQNLYNKIVETYTNVINTVCQFCDNKGIHQTINSWEYKLCLQHYLEYRYEIEVDDEIQYYEESFGRSDNQSMYKNVSTNRYYRLDELVFRRQAEHLHSLLKEKCSPDETTIREIMFTYFSDVSSNDIELDDRSYVSQFRFMDYDKNVIDKPERDYYNHIKAREDIIDEICT